MVRERAAAALVAQQVEHALTNLGELGHGLLLLVVLEDDMEQKLIKAIEECKKSYK